MFNKYVLISAVNFRIKFLGNFIIRDFNRGPTKESLRYSFLKKKSLRILIRLKLYLRTETYRKTPLLVPGVGRFSTANLTNWKNNCDQKQNIF